MQDSSSQQADFLDRILGDELSAAYITSAAVRRKDYALLDAVFSRVPLEWFDQKADRPIFSSRPDGPLSVAVAAGDVQMVRYLHSKGVFASVQLLRDSSVDVSQLPTYSSDVIAKAIDLGYEDVALELIFNHPKYADEFAKPNSLSAFFKSNQGTGFQTVLTSALERGMPRLARAALDRMDVTIQSDLVCASLVGSVLAPEIATKCAGIFIDSVEHFAKSFGTYRFEELDTRKIARAKVFAEAAPKIFSDLVVGCRVPLLSDDFGNVLAISSSLATALENKVVVSDQLFMYVLDSIPLDQLMRSSLDGVPRLNPSLVRDVGARAVRSDRVDVVRELLTRPPWDKAVVSSISEARSREMLDLLVGAGACVDTFNDEGYSPLQESVLAGDFKRIDFWADAGADLSLKTQGGRTLIQISRDEETERFVRSLRMGAKVAAAMSEGVSLEGDSLGRSTSLGPL